MTSCAFCVGSRPKFGESSDETVASVGYKGVKSGSCSKLVEVIADGCSDESRREGVAISTSRSTPYSLIMVADQAGKQILMPHSPDAERREDWLTATALRMASIKARLGESGREITTGPRRRQ